MKTLKKYLLPIIMLVVFETIAVVLWLANDKIFYLFNFTYIGCSIALGITLFIRGFKYARHVTQLLVGLYMLVYLGLICNENMQIEGFWYYLFTGVFEAATIHYAVAKIAGPLLFGRGWCGYACWTAMVLDFLPYKTPKAPRKKLGFFRYITFAVSLIFVACLFLAHDELLLAAADKMRQEKVHFLRKVREGVPDERENHRQFPKTRKRHGMYLVYGMCKSLSERRAAFG